MYHSPIYIPINIIHIYYPIHIMHNSPPYQYITSDSSYIHLLRMLIINHIHPHHIQWVSSHHILNNYSMNMVYYIYYWFHTSILQLMCNPMHITNIYYSYHKINNQEHPYIEFPNIYSIHPRIQYSYMQVSQYLLVWLLQVLQHYVYVYVMIQAYQQLVWVEQ